MQLDSIHAISPLDGRYQKRVHPLSSYFSEYALIRYRLWVEVEYFLDLHKVSKVELSSLNEHQHERLRKIYQSFDESSALRVKEIERRTNHDVKAVEYFLKEKIEDMGEPGIEEKMEYIHFGLTSQDINNTAIPMMIRDSMNTEMIPAMKRLVDSLISMQQQWISIPMLARTHGQAASPTTVGKEIGVFAKRLAIAIQDLEGLSYPAKFGGATGSMNAHYAAFPSQDWQGFAERFVNQTLGLSRSFPTTQIEHYDGLAKIFDSVKRVNTILIDLCQDIWIYISQEYFLQKVKEHEVGSSAMPHKVNPIDFENGEGNLGMSTSILEFFSRKLPISRLQRDLTDSTVLRNVGVAFGYTFLAISSIQKGLGKLTLNETALRADLEKKLGCTG